MLSLMVLSDICRSGVKCSLRKRLTQGGLLSFYYQKLKDREQGKSLEGDCSLAHGRGISKECAFHPVGRNSSVPLVHTDFLQWTPLSQWAIKARRTVWSCTDTACDSCEMMEHHTVSSSVLCSCYDLFA